MKFSTHNLRFRSGGLATWSIHHPVGVVMIALAVVVLGGFALERLAINLLPHLIYPEVRVRIIDPGVPATVMEDRITRQLEEQLAITEDAISVQSRTSEGRSSVDLSFEYGKDIDIALRDASTRLDRAKRFLPTTIDPPVIYKRDPSQIPVAEYVISSSTMNPVELRDWVDNTFSKWFLNLPGVAAVEVGGGLVREIHIRPDQTRLAGLGLSMDSLIDALKKGNTEVPAGRLYMQRQEFASRTAGRFTRVEDIANLPLVLQSGDIVRLHEVAEVIDSHEDERLMVRYNDVAGVKISIQKQPTANTVAVMDAVTAQMQWLEQENLLPNATQINITSDQSVYVRNALTNASTAAISGGLLAMLVVYLFLGNLKHTLIIGSAIPIAIMVTFSIMSIGGLTLNIMTLGGLALGIGMLVDNTIVMLENISRHQQTDSTDRDTSAVTAATEVNSAIVASTSTNLAAVLPFLFIGGLVGLLFRELIFTISAAIIASMVVALTLVPALASRAPVTGVHTVRVRIDNFVNWLRRHYANIIQYILTHGSARTLLLVIFFAGLAISGTSIYFKAQKQEFLPTLDDGRVRVSISADPGISLSEMERAVRRIEGLFRKDEAVEGVFTIVGGRIFGRSEYEASNQSTLTVQLVPRDQRKTGISDWIKATNGKIKKLNLAGFRVRMRAYGIRGIRLGSGDDDLNIRVQGPELATLDEIGDEILNRLRGTKGLVNLKHSSEEIRQELSINVDRIRAASLGLDVEAVGRAVRLALEGEVVTDFIDNDRSYDVRLRLPRTETDSPDALGDIRLFAADKSRPAVYLRDVASIELIPTPAQILRDRQQRIVEISATISGATTGEVYAEVNERLADLELPEGYTWYDAGSLQSLQEGKQLFSILIVLALFLVFVVMAVQYESLLNPIVILLSVPFAIIGIAIGLQLLGLPVSMPVWLGMIMLAGIVVNNAIVLVEYIEILRSEGKAMLEAIYGAARLRLRPILMTTLTTVVGMLPLALNLGEGAEMLQPLAVTIVAGLSFSLLVSLFIVPVIYATLHSRLVKAG
jgi:CzcA family heavy metal efflux pump